MCIVCPSLRFSLRFNIFPKNDLVAKKSLENIKNQKIGAHKEAIGAQKEAMVVKKNLKKVYNVYFA